MSLYGLVPEVLAEIIAYLPATQLFLLLATSNPLRTKILERTNAVIEYSSSSQPARLLPTTFYRFAKVRSVFLQTRWRSHSSALTPDLPHHFAFGTSLSELTVEGLNALAHFLDPGYFSPGLTLISRSAWIDLGAILPNLLTLEIDGFLLKARVDVEVPDTLPRSLTSLTLNLVQRRSKTLFCSAVEGLTNLTHLSLQDTTKYDATALFTNVPHLTSLHLPRMCPTTCLPSIANLSHATFPSVSTDWVEAICRSCVRLTLHSTPIVDLKPLKFLTDLKIVSEINDDALLWMPPSLTRLSVKRFSPVWRLCHLPQSLLHLVVSDAMMFEEAADTLEKLKEVGAKSWLPPRLETFSVSLDNTDTLSEDWWPLFPHSLTQLDPRVNIETKKEGVVKFTDFFPNLEDRLTLSSDWRSRVYNTYQSCYGTGWVFPEKLKSLAIHLPPYNLILEENRESFESRPSLLDSCSDSWPMSLTCLSMIDINFPVANCSLKSLPRSLISLYMVIKGKEKGLVELRGRAAVRNPVPPQFIRTLSDLPPILTTLFIDCNLIMEDPDAVLSALPRTITDLSLPSLRNIKNEHVRLLPPTLTAIELLFVQDLTDASAAMLPTTLISVLFRLNRGMTLEALRLIPSSITYLNLKKNVNFRRYQLDQALGIVKARKMRMSLVTKKMNFSETECKL